MKISRFGFSLLITWITLTVLLVSFGGYIVTSSKIQQANDNRYASFQLATQLRQSSDDLTRMVRTYVATGDPLYKQHYQEILDIRDGKKPRPLAYQNIYWDLVSASDHRPRGFGPAVALLDLMKSQGFSADELGKLAEAKANSDGLTRIEFDAMKMIEQPKVSDVRRLKAIEVLNDAVYHQAKAGIMLPINDFYELVEQRTQKKLDETLALAAVVRAVFIASGLLLLLMLWKLHRAQQRFMQELKDREAYTRDLVNSMAEAAYGIDRHGRCTFVNRALLDLLGYGSEAEVIGQNAHALFHHSHADGSAFAEADCPINLALTTGPDNRVHASSDVFWSKVGTPVDVEYWSLPLLSGGNHIGSITTFVDITERKRSERTQERLVNQLTRINEELNNFAYVASHDLKSPLRGIDQLASWVAEDLAGTLNADTRDHLRLMQSRVKRMEMLLDDLLAYSRAGRSIDEMIEVDTRELVDNIFEMARTNKPIALQILGELPVLQTRKVPLELALRNLVSNAIKHHSRPLGRVSVSACAVSNGYEFTVSDDGPGIAPEHQQRVFGMFQTLKPRDEVEGSGMGLALVKKAVESMGGSVTLESDGHSGCTFRFIWPTTDTKENLI